jgi:hypothetical protein
MMNRKTLGLWAVTFPADGFTTRHPVISADYGHVARAEWQGDVQSTNAHAQLIAAVPDMLETLRDIVGMLTDANDMRADALHAARTAIVRATGGQV